MGGAGTRLRRMECGLAMQAGLAVVDEEVLDLRSSEPLAAPTVSGWSGQPYLPPAAGKTLKASTIAEEQGVKSRHRVKVYGEVFTQRRMVDQMLDLVREDVETGPDFVDKTFLEPAAGDGNFLVAILHRKLRAIEERYPRQSWPHESLFALASIYGIELLEDNHLDAKQVMLNEFLRFHVDHGVRCGRQSHLRRAATFLIHTNVIRGDTLSGKTWRGEDIQLSWWNRVPGSLGMVRRELFTLASLRGDPMLELTPHEKYAACRIDRVHEEVRAGD